MTGVNFLFPNGLQLPINRPRMAAANYNQDGAANSGARKGEVNYQPSAHAPLADNAEYKYAAAATLATAPAIYSVVGGAELGGGAAMHAYARFASSARAAV